MDRASVVPSWRGGRRESAFRDTPGKPPRGLALLEGGGKVGETVISDRLRVMTGGDRGFVA